MYKETLNRINKTWKPWIAKHPKNGLYYGIDKTLRCPVTDGFKTNKEAIDAWYRFQATAICDKSTQNLNSV